jgi:hypothetical protein
MVNLFIHSHTEKFTFSLSTYYFPKTHFNIILVCTPCYYIQLLKTYTLTSTGCSFCRLIRRAEHLIGRHWYLPAYWRSFIRWSPDQWVSPCYAIEHDRSYYCALFFMTLWANVQAVCSLNTRYKRVWKFHNFYFAIFSCTFFKLVILCRINMQELY